MWKPALDDDSFYFGGAGSLVVDLPTVLGADPELGIAELPSASFIVSGAGAGSLSPDLPARASSVAGGVLSCLAPAFEGESAAMLAVAVKSAAVRIANAVFIVVLLGFNVGERPARRVVPKHGRFPAR